MGSTATLGGRDIICAAAPSRKMLSSTNFWMGLAGLIYLVAGVFVLRKQISAARGWDTLITLVPVFIAVPLAVFAPEHFRGPEFVQNMVPSWMPAHRFWPLFVGGALLAATTSLRSSCACPPPCSR